MNMNISQSDFIIILVALGLVNGCAGAPFMVLSYLVSEFLSLSVDFVE